jgi:hypothetical protein
MAFAKPNVDQKPQVLPLSIGPRLRLSERFALAYFAYVAIVATIRIHRPWRAWLLLAAVAATSLLLSRIANDQEFTLGLRKLNGKDHLRDWIPLAFALAAFREMDWFTPAVRDRHLENQWILWDRWLLQDLHLRAALEALGTLIPNVLELCYLLVYGVAPIVLAIVILNHPSRREVDRLWLAYFAGTLTCYGLFPYFPSDPPRVVFPAQDLPLVTGVFRHWNLAILGNFGIHVSVFPSAHVGSALAGAWALFALLPAKRWIGRSLAIYGIAVAIATIYGRYHYAADALAGIAMSGWAILTLWLSRDRVDPSAPARQQDQGTSVRPFS